MQQVLIQCSCWWLMTPSFPSHAELPGWNKTAGSHGSFLTLAGVQQGTQPQPAIHRSDCFWHDVRLLWSLWAPQLASLQFPASFGAAPGRLGFFLSTGDWPWIGYVWYWYIRFWSLEHLCRFWIRRCWKKGYAPKRLELDLIWGQVASPCGWLDSALGKWHLPKHRCANIELRSPEERTALPQQADGNDQSVAAQLQSRWKLHSFATWGVLQLPTRRTLRRGEQALSLTLPLPAPRGCGQQFSGFAGLALGPVTDSCEGSEHWCLPDLCCRKKMVSNTKAKLLSPPFKVFVSFQRFAHSFTSRHKAAAVPEDWSSCSTEYTARSQAPLNKLPPTDTSTTTFLSPFAPQCKRRTGTLAEKILKAILIFVQLCITEGLSKSLQAMECLPAIHHILSNFTSAFGSAWAFSSLCSSFLSILKAVLCQNDSNVQIRSAKG